MAYRTVLFDLDHTLLDSDTSMKLAFDHTLKSAGIAPKSDHFPIYDRINQGMWAAVERGETSPNAVKVARWEQFALELGAVVDPLDLAATFVEGLSQFGELYDGARALLDDVRERATLGLVTNGLSEVQRARIERLELGHYFSSIAISGELGVAKPDNAFLDVVFAELSQPERSTTVIVGDSLTSDMAAGHNYGISTCWYNPEGKPPPDQPPTYEASDFDEIRSHLFADA
ncbi:MAG: noncanonical pyrimidine nucleotidase, YjjG family [Acidimicrobiales bacterium]|nr:noncanonical pyrimidine nucleotidase, YjjG family [Acidimicrobiales bacterium]RZV46948.1 MAG: noncanonical pyrimidine nucleotidase, YjjG family [Acidimicrobiales bacterium]